MKKTNVLVLTIITALLLSACGAAPENKPANTANTNTAKPVASAPTADMLLAMDRQANEAWIKGDGNYFEGFLSDKFVSYDMGQRMTKADIAKMISEVKCDVKDWKLEEPQMAMIDADTYAVTYKGTFDGSCSMGGKSEKLPSPVRAASVYVRSGDKWLGAWHGETPMMGAKSDAQSSDKKDDAKKDQSRKNAASADVAGVDAAGADVSKKEQPKKEAEAAKDASRKEEPKKNEAKKDDKAANNAAPAKPVAGPNTDALTKLHQAGWEAWMKKDAAWFQQNTASNLAFVDPAGNWFGNKAATIAQWTEGMKCEGVTKVSVTDGFATALSPTVEIFTHKGTANGTCDGQKNGALWGTAFYVKEGNDWKMAFMFESPAGK